MELSVTTDEKHKVLKLSYKIGDYGSLIFVLT